jgi:hypothetical protein
VRERGIGTHYWDTQTRQERNTKIAEKRSLGFTHKDLAVEFRLCTNSISSILKARRNGWIHPYSKNNLLTTASEGVK